MNDGQVNRQTGDSLLSVSVILEVSHGLKEQRLCWMKSSHVPSAVMSPTAAGGPSGSRSSFFGGVKPGSISKVEVEMLEITVQLCRCVCVCLNSPLLGCD